jgi:enoyl-CoA hydratase/carnithine racemase
MPNGRLENSICKYQRRFSMTIQNFETLKIQVDGPVSRLILNRPERMNALSHTVLDELQAAAAWIDHEETIKVVVLQGAGEHFCRGADVGGQRNEALSQREMLDLGRKMTDRIALMRPIVIAQLKGYVFGGGFVLALACDIRIAAENVSMWLPEAILGWPVPWGCVPRLVREVGPQAAKEIILACPILNGREAFQLGLVRRIVPTNELDAVVSDLATEIARRPAVVIDIIKRQVTEAAEDIASTSRSQTDMERMMVALNDEEALRATQEGLADIVKKFNLQDQLTPT